MRILSGCPALGSAQAELMNVVPLNGNGLGIS